MAAKIILKDTKTPLLLFRRQLLAVAAVPKTTSPNPQLIQASNQNPLPHIISDLRHYLYQPPSPMLSGLAETLGRLQVRGSDDDEDRGSDDDDDEENEEMTDDEDSDPFTTDYESNEEETYRPYLHDSD